MKKFIIIGGCIAVCLLSIFCFNAFALDQVTLTTLSQNPKETKSKYEKYWDDTTIKTKPLAKKAYKPGDKVATVTIPKLSYYERPVYYGSDAKFTNWQITTPGYQAGWDLFGEKGRAAVGAHNYQLFGKLPNLVPGDKFIVENEEDIYVYEVTGHHIYNHKKENWNDVSYEAADPYSVTLMTCYPIDAVDTDDMYLVYSKLVRGTIYK